MSTDRNEGWHALDPLDGSQNVNDSISSDATNANEMDQSDGLFGVSVQDNEQPTATNIDDNAGFDENALLCDGSNVRFLVQLLSFHLTISHFVLDTIILVMTFCSYHLKEIVRI